MTPKERNLKIAHAIGIVSGDDYGPLYKTNQGYVRDCPDFVNDLNACYDFEETLTLLERGEYARTLSQIAWESDDPSFLPIHATPKQRCKAFLIVKKPLGRMKKPKRRYRQTGQERSGIKETDNLFMDEFNWREFNRRRDEFNRRCDEFMRSRGFKHQPTPTTLEA